MSLMRVDNSDLVRQPLHSEVGRLQRRLFEDSGQPVRASATDLGARVPPETGHADDSASLSKSAANASGSRRFHASTNMTTTSSGRLIGVSLIGLFSPTDEGALLGLKFCSLRRTAYARGPCRLVYPVKPIVGSIRVMRRY